MNYLDYSPGGRHCVTDEQWNLISEFFPVRNCKTGAAPRNRRQIVDGILWSLRTGSPWRDVPEKFGPWSTVWDFFDKWQKDGTWDSVLARLRKLAIPEDAEFTELWCIDGTSIRAARCSSGGGKNEDRKKRNIPFDKLAYKKRSIVENLIG